MGIGGTQVLSLGSSLILTRLLLPKHFGLMAVVFVLIRAMQMLSDLGIGPSIIQNEKGDEPTFLNTAWTLQIVRGFIIWGIVLLITWPARWFYDEPQLLWLLPIVSLTAVLSGFDSTARYTVNRHLVLGKLTCFDLGAQLLSIIIMVIWGLRWPSVWVLVGGALISYTVRMALSHHLLPGQKNRLQWDSNACRAVIHFGKWIFLTSAVGFLADEVTWLILAKLIPFAMIGIYSLAYKISNLPNSVVAQLGLKVIFPAASRCADLPRADLRALVLKNRWPFLCVLALLVTLLAGFGDILIKFLYDSRWHDASWMLCILALGLWPRMLTNTMGPALLAIGQPRYFAYSGILRFAVLMVAVPTVYYFYGMPGVVITVALSGLADYMVETYGLWKHELLVLRQDLKMTLLWGLLIACCLIVRKLFGLGLPFIPSA